MRHHYTYLTMYHPSPCHRPLCRKLTICLPVDGQPREPAGGPGSVGLILFAAASMAEVYHCSSFPSGDERGCRTLCDFQRVRGFSPHEEQAKTVLRQEGSALRHLQLLPEKALPRISARQECVRENSHGSAKAPSVFDSWICADARARAPVIERAWKRYAVQSRAGIETKSLASFAQEKNAKFPRAARAAFFGREKRTETILAKAVL